MATKGLYANIHAKRKRIAEGSGEKMRKVGSKGAPTANLPNWYEYPASNVNNIGDNAGKIVYTELFPAVRVASIFSLIQSKYAITFNGIFLQSDLFKKAFLLYKNKESYHYTNNPVELDFTSTSDATQFNLSTNSFQLTNQLQIDSTLFFNCQSLSISPSDYFIDVYANGVLLVVKSGTTTGGLQQFQITPEFNQVITFKIRSYYAITIGINLTCEKAFYDTVTQDTTYIQQTAVTTATTTSFTDLAGLAPDMKISDFITGICKEFNLTVYSNTKNVFTFEPIPYWYSKGIIRDITKFTDITTIEVERMKLYKSIEFKYQDSECMLNKYFLESPLNADAHGYGNTKIGWNYDGGEYKIESPFENLLHNNFGNNLQVGYCLNKELAPYIPKPVLLYMNTLTTLTAGDKIHWDGLPNIAEYVPFGQDSEILFVTGLIPLTLNFGEEISSFYLYYL